eukprot:GHVL01020873.1.p1 GENE.GHVL01020873.1~~GHVL01020873.1.p1  ORF type:complete len:174 (-),score=36.88 GHVL01020873.1:59-580(-)
MLSYIIFISYFYTFFCDFCENKEEKECFLDVHNYYRCLHGVDDLIWNDEIFYKIKNVTDVCVMDSSDSFSTMPPTAENMAVGYSIEEVVWAWYNENIFYNFLKPSFSDKTGHFTAMIWKSTRQIACSSCFPPEGSDTPGSSKLYMCQYGGSEPNVNHPQIFRQNVKPILRSEC